MTRPMVVKLLSKMFVLILQIVQSKQSIYLMLLGLWNCCPGLEQAKNCVRVKPDKGILNLFQSINIIHKGNFNKKSFKSSPCMILFFNYC